MPTARAWYFAFPKLSLLLWLRRFPQGLGFLLDPSNSSRPVRPRRGEDDEGRDCDGTDCLGAVLDGVDGRRLRARNVGG